MHIATCKNYNWTDLKVTFGVYVAEVKVHCLLPKIVTQILRPHAEHAQINIYSYYYPANIYRLLAMILLYNDLELSIEYIVNR